MVNWSRSLLFTFEARGSKSNCQIISVGYLIKADNKLLRVAKIFEKYFDETKKKIKTLA